MLWRYSAGCLSCRLAQAFALGDMWYVSHAPFCLVGLCGVDGGFMIGGCCQGTSTFLVLQEQGCGKSGHAAARIQQRQRSVAFVCRPEFSKFWLPTAQDVS